MPFTALEAAVRLAAALLSVLVFVVGLAAYARRPTRRTLTMLGLFTVFLVQGVLLLYELFVADSAITETAYFAFQFVEVLLVTIVLVKR